MRADSGAVTAPLGVRRYHALRALTPVTVRAAAPRHSRRVARPDRLRALPELAACVTFAAVLGVDLAATLAAGAAAYVGPVAVAAWRRGAGRGVALAAASVVPLVARAADADAIGLRLLALALAAVAAAQMADALRRVVERDELTGLLGRRGLARVAAAELARARHTRRALSVAFLDVDDFKAINDRFGHVAGDDALAAVGRALAAGRPGDLAARFGGDEFVVILPGCDRVEARRVVERLVAHAGAELARLGVLTGLTAGVVTFLGAPADVDALLRPADDLLLHGKARRKGAVWSMYAHDPVPHEGART